MEDVDFSDEFCRFIQAHVPSVDVAEALLAQYRLHNMVRAAGFSEDELARHLATLAQAYEQRPVTTRAAGCACCCGARCASFSSP
jgi:hypothetical protein